MTQCVVMSQPFALVGLPASAWCRMPVHRQTSIQASARKDKASELLKLSRRHDRRDSGGHDNLHDLQTLLGCDFHDPQILLQAVTHRSAAQKSLDSNQRLEYLGDAVLGMVVAEHVFRTFPQFDEGILSTVRKEVVSARALASVAHREGLGRFALMNAYEEATGGRNKDALLSDLVESLIAAAYIDQGMDFAHDLVLRWLGNDIERAARDPSGSDSKSKLQEYLRHLDVPSATYHVVENGPKHNQKFISHVLIADKRLGWGTGKTKKAAEQAAAKYSLELIAQKSAEDLTSWCASFAQSPR